MNPLPRRPPTLEERVQALEAWRRERDATDDRRKDELQHEVQSLIAGARGSVETAAKTALMGVGDKLDKLDQIFALNQEQSSMLEEARDESKLAREERLRRRGREEAEEDARRRKKEFDDSAAVELLRVDALRKHRLAVATVFVSILTIVAGLVAAAISSHQ